MYLLFHYVKYEGSDLIGWFPTFEDMKQYLARMKAEDEYVDLQDYEYVYADPTQPHIDGRFSIPYQKVVGDEKSGG